MFWSFAFHCGETLRKQERLKCNLKHVVRFRSGSKLHASHSNPATGSQGQAPAVLSVPSRRSAHGQHLACCSPRVAESDTTERLPWTEWVFCRRTSLFHPFTQQRTFVLFLAWGNYEQRCYRCFCTVLCEKRFLILSSEYPGARLWSHVATGSEPDFPGWRSQVRPHRQRWAEPAAQPPGTWLLARPLRLRVSCGFHLLFLECLITPSIFSDVYLPSTYPLQWNVCSDLCSLFYWIACALSCAVGVL